jgi:hypothetical protein
VSLLDPHGGAAPAIREINCFDSNDQRDRR